MTHETYDALILGCAALSALAAIIVPLMTKSAVKRDLDTSWGAMTERVSGHGERLHKAEGTIAEHETRISRIEGGGKLSGRFV